MKNALEKFEALAAIETFEERLRVAELEEAFEGIKAHQEGVMESFRRVSMQRGIPVGTVKRLYYKWLKGGAAALADGRKRQRGKYENPFYQCFKTFAENDKNGCKGGWDEMMRRFRAGEALAGVGTWRDAWRREYEWEEAPARCPSGWVPRGATYANLMALYHEDPARKLALAWNRQGMFAASKGLVPVLRSRVGLHVGEVYEADDVWHNIDVFAPFAKGVFQPLEFAVYDVASAFKAASLMKPRLRLVDEKTGKEKYDNLKEFQFRALVANMMCCTGFYKGGVTLVGEHGTTRLSDTVLRRIAAVPGWGRLFTFKTSGIMNTPVHKGLFMGSAGGNPRMKSLCECSHNIMHNATASLPGNRGRDAAHYHESQRALVKYSTAVIETARKLDPVLEEELALPILSWDAYTQKFREIEDEVMDRREHELEGWTGREVVEYRLLETSEDWLPIKNLADMSPEGAAAVRAVLALNPRGLMRQRKMSRREVWKAGRGELVKWPLMEMAAFLDPEKDVRTAKVRGDGTIMFEDAIYYPGEKKWYLAEYTDRRGLAHRLVPGDTVRFFWNPCGELQRWIWICDEKGDTLGMAPALKTAAWVDEKSIEAAMGQRQHQMAALLEDTRMRHAAAHLRKEAAQAWNMALIEDAKGAAPPQQTNDRARTGALSLDELNEA